MSVTSAAASLTVVARHVITEQPKDVSTGVGKQARFAVKATGSNLAYRRQTVLPGKTSWQDTNLSGCDTDTLGFKAAIGQSGRRYRCVVTDGNGFEVVSNVALLTVTQPDDAAVTRQPASVTATEGQTATFSVATSGMGLSFRWQTRLAGSSS